MSFKWNYLDNEYSDEYNDGVLKGPLPYDEEICIVDDYLNVFVAEHKIDNHGVHYWCSDGKSNVINEECKWISINDVVDFLDEIEKFTDGGAYFVGKIMS